MALSMTPEKALSYILDSKNPLEVVHSLPEEDFYFLVKDIGQEDALPIISLASNKQLEYLLDIDIWSRDRFNNHSMTQQLGLLLKANPQRITQWLSTQKTDFLEFFLFKNFEVIMREPDQEPADFGKEFITFDDIFYFKFIEFPPGMEITEDASAEHSANGYLKDRERLLMEFIKLLSDINHPLFQSLLMQSATIIPSETEEELYRLRNVRLAEKGFLPFEESIGIYQPLKPRDFNSSRQKRLSNTDDVKGLLPAPLFANQMIDEESLFAKALTSVSNQHIVLQLQSEFAALCNQLIVADRKVIIERLSLKDAVKKACGYISIGLHNLSGEHPDLIRRYPLSDLFRVGYGLALALKWRTEKWREKSWFATEGLPLSFWGEEWLGVIGGLLLKKPLFFDNYETGVLYREFTTMNDIIQTETELNEIIALDNLLARLSIPIKPLPGHILLTHKNLILSQWARFHLGIDRERPAILTIPMDVFKTFFSDLWNPGKIPRTIKLAMKTTFLKWLSTASGLSGTEITDQSGNTLEKLFVEIESEYGEIDERSLNPRFIPHFLIEK